MNTSITVAGAAVLVMLTAGCGNASSSSEEVDEVVTIALIPPTSGALAQYGTDAVKGWQLAVDKANESGGVAGHKVELVIKETDSDPAQTLRAAREATSKDGARFISGVITSPENSAINAQLPSLGALSFNAAGKDDGLIGSECTARSFHVVQTVGMDIEATASALTTLPGERWAIQAVDYSNGHGAAEVFAAAAEKAGKQIVLTQFAPLNTTDFGSYLTKIQQSGADALFAVEQGADGVAFVKQADQFGLPKQLKTVLGSNMVTEPLFPALGEAVLGYYGNVGYDVTSDIGLNQEFVAAYTAEFGAAPYYVPADNYLAAETLFAGIEKAGSVDPDDVAAALEGLSFDSIVGPVTLRAADHQLLRPSYVGKVVERGGGLAFDIVGRAEASTTTPEPSSECEL